jgi:hypothetical protein
MAIKTNLLCTLIAALLYLSNTIQALATAETQPTMGYPLITREGLSRRQLAQYDFLQRHLEPDILEENPIIKQLRIWVKIGVTYGITGAVSYTIAWLIWQLPFIQGDLQTLTNLINYDKWRLKIGKYAQERAQRFNAYFDKYQPECHQQGPTDQVINTIENKIQEREEALTEFTTLFWTVYSILFAFLKPFVRDIVDDYLPDNPFSYANILAEFVKHWQEYRICTPKEFHYEFDILHLCACITGKKLIIDEAIAELIIAGIVMQVIDTTVGSETSN